MRNFITLDEALQLDSRRNSGNHKRHLNPRLASLLEAIGAGQPIVRASGPYYWDVDGNRFLDFLSAFGALPFGHNPPSVCSAVERVASAPNLVEGMSLLAGALARNLTAIAPPELTRVFFANSGTEVVDAAIKLARAATGRSRLIACQGAFHGRSIGALSLMDLPEHSQPFSPLLADVSFIRFGDYDALDAALSRRDVAAFIVEPIQGEAGMIAPPESYMKEARALCARRGTLFVADEIQTGLCRTGRMFACEYESIVPDVLLLGKALGGGVMALSALLTTDRLFRAGKGGTPRSPFHESTYAANTRACAAGIATLEMLIEARMDRRAAESGAYLLRRLEDLQRVHGIIAAVRGRGLMMGIEFAPATAGIATFATRGLLNRLSRKCYAAIVMRDLLAQHRIMTCFTLNNPNVLRLQPPLDITKDDMDFVIDCLDRVLTASPTFARAAARSVRVVAKAHFA